MEDKSFMDFITHDVAHCLDYKEGSCPDSCYRAQVTKDLKPGMIVSFASFYGSTECGRTIYFSGEEQYED